MNTDLTGFSFEWDADKNSRNQRKRGVSFEEASTVFADVLSMTVHDPLHSGSEDRFVTEGMSHTGRILVVVHVDRGDNIRVLSARVATPAERRSYEEGK